MRVVEVDPLVGGAQRIELCSNLGVGGLTPGSELMIEARSNVQVPIFAMIRPRAGDFVYSDEEFATMRASIRLAKQMQMDGLVLGLLRADGRVAIQRTKELIGLASPTPVTFHRAFDECRDLRESLEEVIKTGATRLLTSGGKQTAPEALELLGDLVRIARDRLIVIQEAVAKTAASEYHAGLSSVVAAPRRDLGAFEQAVREMASVLASSD